MGETPLRSRRCPAVGPARNATEASKAAGPSPGGRRALVAEADPATLRLCRQALEDFGFAVEAVDSGIAAVVAARQGRPDLILVAFQLRDVSGREAIGWLRSNPALKSTPIIALTTIAEDEAAVVAARPDTLLRKPLSPASIRRAIRKVLTQASHVDDEEMPGHRYNDRL